MTNIGKVMFDGSDRAVDSQTRGVVGRAAWTAADAARDRFRLDNIAIAR